MKLSEALSRLLLEYADKPLPIYILLKHAGSNGFGMIAGMLTIPMLIPIPIPLAGFSALVGSGIILVGCQLTLGFDKPYLPKCIARQKLSPNASQKLLKSLNHLLQPLESMSRRRFSLFTNDRWWGKVTGACLAWDALLLSLPLPIPFTNLVPAYTILFLAIGLLESDGLFILVGYALTTATTIFFGSIASIIWQLITQWLKYN
jgi:hypothetical protein